MDEKQDILSRYFELDDWQVPTEWNETAYTKICERIKSFQGHLHALSEAFVELPSKEDYPDYYQEIKKPMSLTIIQQKIANQGYSTLDDFVADFELIFKNAKTYNAERSIIYEDADDLNMLFNALIGRELRSKDREPLAHVEWNGETYTVGDFAYIKNENDEEKPIILHILKLFKANDGHHGVCGVWFLRPEQTVHAVVRKFMPQELMATTHFEGYKLEDVVGKCHVQYVNHYVKGAPKNSQGHDLWVCESQYEEETHKFYKFQDWNEYKESVLPKQLKQGYEPELDLYNEPLKIVKYRTTFGKKRSPEDGEDAEAEANANANANAEEEQEQPVKRKRGRPPKNKYAASPTSTVDKSRAGSVERATPDPSTPGPSGKTGDDDAMSTDSPISSVVAVEELPQETAENFVRDEHGRVMFYPMPPLDVVRAQPLPGPSLAYLKFKSAKKRSRQDNGSDSQHKKPKSTTQSSGDTAGENGVALLPTKNGPRTSNVLSQAEIARLIDRMPTETRQKVADGLMKYAESTLSDLLS